MEREPLPLTTRWSDWTESFLKKKILRSLENGPNLPESSRQAIELLNDDA